MTREKALEVSNLIFKIDRYEALMDELKGLTGLEELYEVFCDTELEDNLVAIIQIKIDEMIKELDGM